MSNSTASRAIAAAVFSRASRAATVSAAYDQAIANDADNGRISAMFAASLESDYGLILPLKPSAAVVFTNEYFTAARCNATSRAVALALHALCSTLHDSGKVKSLPRLSALPEAFDPIAIAAAKAAKAAAKAATKAATKADSGDSGDSVTTDSAPGSDSGNVSDLTSGDIRMAVAIVQAAMLAGRFTSFQCDEITKIAATCPRATDKRVRITKGSAAAA